MNNNASKKAKRNGKDPLGQKVGAFVATASTQRSTRPKGGMTAQNSRRIIHRELVGSVSGSTSFNVTRYALNPGLSLTFPWLSSQATGWEQYRFNMLKFEYITRCATSTAGSVILSPEYDPSDAPPANEAAATNAMDSVEDAPWKNISCSLTTTAMFPQGPRKFIRSSNVAGDVRNFDAGAFFLCTVEEAGTDPIGKLWVEYDVELFVPQTAVQAPVGTQTSMFAMTADQTFVTGVSGALYLGGVIVDALRIGIPALGVYTPPAGAYRILLSVRSSDSAAELFTTTFTLYKNGVSSGFTSVVEDDSTAGGDRVQTLLGYLSMNGSDTFQIQATMIGAAGTLKAMTGSTFLQLVPA